MEKIEILNKAAEALEKQTGLVLRYQDNNLEDKNADYSAKIKPPGKKSKEIAYFIQVKKIISNAALGQTAVAAKLNSQRTVLVTEQITPNQAVNLRQLDISFFDTAGNAYFNAPGLYVFVVGNKAELKSEKPISIFNANGIKLLFHFLLQPQLVMSDYRTIEMKTGVARATIGRILQDLEKAGFLLRHGNHDRILIRKEELLKRWVETYSEKLRIKLDPVRFHSTKFTGRWWEEIDIAEYKAVWGGETGGAILTKHLKPQTATIYADSILPRLQAKYGLVRDAKGEIEILRKFWMFGEIGNVAPPLVVYADLLETADDRNLETAQILYDKYLAQIAE